MLCMGCVDTDVAAVFDGLLNDLAVFSHGPCSSGDGQGDDDDLYDEAAIKR